MKIYKQIVVFFAIASLAGCITNDDFGENAYLGSDAAPSLKAPKDLQDTTYLKPLYPVPEGPVATQDDDKISPEPPNIID